LYGNMRARLFCFGGIAIKEVCSPVSRLAARSAVARR
jgi:hypothetical protein